MLFRNRLPSIWLWSLAALLCGGACRQAPAPPPPATPAPAVVASVAPSPVAEAPLTEGESAPAPSVVIANAYRAAGLQSRELEIQEVDFRKPPIVGAAVTLIPLGVNLPATQTRILQVDKTPDPCSETLPPWWSLKLAPLTEARFVQAEAAQASAESDVNYPFKICVLYPAVATARALNRGLLDAANLPKGVRPEQVLLALDLDGDDTPDFVLAEHCCDKPQAPLKDCDLTCRKTWQRRANQWTVLDAGTPC